MKANLKRAQDRQNYYVFWYYVKKNNAGGQAYYLPNTHPWLLDNILNPALPMRGVNIQEPLGELRYGAEYEGALTCIHKVKDDRDIYFFANSSPKDIDTKVVLPGHKTLTIWNPHTGAQEPAEITPVDANGQPINMVRLKLASVSSRFFVAE